MAMPENQEHWLLTTFVIQTKDENTRKNHVPPCVQIVKGAYGL
jgi:hypothetical protein